MQDLRRLAQKGPFFLFYLRKRRVLAKSIFEAFPPFEVMTWNIFFFFTNFSWSEYKEYRLQVIKAHSFFYKPKSELIFLNFFPSYVFRSFKQSCRYLNITRFVSTSCQVIWCFPILMILPEWPVLIKDPKRLIPKHA